MARRRRREGSYEYWVEAIERARKAGGEAARGSARLWRAITRGLQERPEPLLAGPPRAYLVQEGTPAWEGYRTALTSRVYGVDSSRTPLIRLGFAYVSFASAAAVRVEPSGSGGVEHVLVREVIVEEPGADAAGLQLTLEMFRLEAEALRRVAGRGPVLLDGPLVDPPSLAGRAGAAGLDEEFLEYLDLRVRGIARATSAGLVGFVKRLGGRLVAGALEASGAGYLAGVSDALLGAALAGYIRRLAESLGACGSGGPLAVAVSRPVPLDPRGAADARLYEERLTRLGGGRIYTAIVIPGVCRGNTWRAARIEFVSRGGDPGREALYYAGMVEALALPGVWVPAPVLLAHRACTIRRRESLRLLREAASRYALETLRLEGLEPGGGIEEAFTGS